MTIQEIINQTKVRLTQGVNYPIMIMIAGGSATGKSSQILPQLLDAFGDDVLLVEQDWYQLGEQFIDKNNTPYKWDDPRNFQIERFITDLVKLRKGESVSRPSFRVAAGKSEGNQIIFPKPVIVVDGIYSLHGGVEKLADFSIYATMPLYARFLRRLFRGVYEQEQPSPEIPFKHAFGSVLRAHQDLVSKQSTIADCVVSMRYSFVDTIRRYNLRPLPVLIPQNAELLFEHEGLQFLGTDENEQYHFYITYNGAVYCDFFVAQERKALLEDLDYLSV